MKHMDALSMPQTGLSEMHLPKGDPLFGTPDTDVFLFHSGGMQIAVNPVDGAELATTQALGEEDDTSAGGNPGGSVDAGAGDGMASGAIWPGLIGTDPVDGAELATTQALGEEDDTSAGGNPGGSVDAGAWTGFIGADPAAWGDFG